jgi:ADP-ribosylglycohydrolase
MLMAHWLNGEERHARIAEMFGIGCDVAAITHGHPSGYLTAGVLAVLVALLLKGDALDAALDEALAELRRHPRHEETLSAIEEARALARTRPGERAALTTPGRRMGCRGSACDERLLRTERFRYRVGHCPGC